MRVPLSVCAMIFGGAAFAGCVVPHGSETRVMHHAHYFMAEKDVEALIQQSHAAGEYIATKSGNDQLVCIEAATTAFCSNGVVVCAHFLMNADQTKVLLNEQTHKLIISDCETANGMPDVISQKITYGGAIERRFAFIGDHYELTDDRVVGPYPPENFDPSQETMEEHYFTSPQGCS